MQWRLMQGNIIKKRLITFAFEKTPLISLTCKLAPVQYQEYGYGLFVGKFLYSIDVPIKGHCFQSVMTHL